MNITRKEFFNKNAADWLEMWYKNTKTGKHNLYEKRFKKLCSLLPIRTSKCILDVGAGSGVLVPYLLMYLPDDGKLIELDYSEEMIKENKKLHKDKRIEFINADILNRPLMKASCDLVVCFACFPHLDNKPEAIQIMTDTLRQRGQLCIAHFHSSDELNKCHSKHPAVMHDTLPNRKDMSCFLKNAGLDIMQFTNRKEFYFILCNKK
jgi:ubiquinone/menaquinone biosynthesis C-methylase UbiE